MIASFDAPPFVRPNISGIKHGHVEEWFSSRVDGQQQFTQNIARMLWIGYDRMRLQAIYEALSEHAFHLDCGRGLAV